MIKLRTTKEQRARTVLPPEMLLPKCATSYAADLAVDVNTLLSALIAEKRAHVKTMGAQSPACPVSQLDRLLDEADALEKLR